MTIGPRYQVAFRRRREGKTNYHKRLGLMISKRPRIVVRKSGRNFIMQLIEHDIAGDQTLISASALDLKLLGYNAATGNTPAAYLTGLLFGSRAVKAGYASGVLDIGLNVNSRGSRVYAAVLGALEVGMDIPHGGESLPGRERVYGEHVAEYASSIPERFSRYGIDPKELPRHVEEVKRAITSAASESE